MDIDELWPQLINIVVPQPRVNVSGNPDRWEVERLCQIAVRIVANTVFEIGTFNGATADVLSHLPRVRQVWTLDLPRDADPILPLADDDWHWLDSDKMEFNDKVIQLWGDSATFDFSLYEGRCDLVFVQGAHSLEYIRNDLAIAQQIVTDKGVIVLHAGTPRPIRSVAREHELVMIGDRMAVVDYRNGAAEI